MTSEEHLQASDILAFRARRLSATDHTAATRHLLQCAECRDRLPLPTVNKFWNCLMGDDDQPAEPISWIGVKSYLADTLFGGSIIRKVFVAGSFFVAVFGLSTALLFNRYSQNPDNVVAVVTDNEMQLPSLPNHEVETHADVNHRNDTNPSSQDPGPIPIPSKRRSGEELPLSKHERKTLAPRAASDGVASRNAGSRGPSLPCGEHSTIRLETIASASGVRLIWGKVKGALSYAVFLSDLDEHLIDSYETTDETSYMVSQTLDPDTFYRWKLLVTLRDGKTMVGTSENFKLAADPASGENRPKVLRLSEKSSASVRCVENK